MSEIINVDKADLKSMSNDALNFFAEELKAGNHVRVDAEDADAVVIKSVRDWDAFLLRQKLRKPPEKKIYRI